MTLTVKSSGNIINSSLVVQWVGTEDEYLRVYRLDPIRGGGSITFSKYTPTDEGYHTYEDFYSFRNGRWYLTTSSEGRDCDGEHSTSGDYVWDGTGWEKLGRTRCYDQFAESMGY